MAQGSLVKKGDRYYRETASLTFAEFSGDDREGLYVDDLQSFARLD